MNAFRSSLRSMELPRDVSSLRFAALILAIVIYGACGSPTPDDPGLAEAVIGSLLVIAVSARGVAALFFDFSQPWKNAGRFALAAGFLIGTASAAVHGQSVHLIARDLIPFLFLFLPLMADDLFEDRPRRGFVLLAAVILAGLMFSARALLDVAQLASIGELTYLANAPGVLLAAFILTACPAANFLKRFDVSSLALMLLAFALACLPVAAMALAVQRASLGFLAAALLWLLLAGWRYRPARRMAVLSACILLLAAPLWHMGLALIDIMQTKTAIFGLNMRAEEWAAVWAEIGQTPAGVLFGKGWGGTFASPAVAGITVNFTHSLLSSALLKTGILGLLALLCYLAALARLWLRLLHGRFILGLALLGPLLIDVFLYASYKSLDFGLLLLLIPAFSGLHAPAQLHLRPSYSIQNQAI